MGCGSVTTRRCGVKAVFDKLDHIAIVVGDTEAALTFYRDTLRLPFLFDEVLTDQPVRVTHLDLGACHLQLVEPLRDDHPLAEFLRQHGEALHHVCFGVEDVVRAIDELPGWNLRSRDAQPRSGPRGRLAVFIEPSGTRGVRLELTSDRRAG